MASRGSTEAITLRMAADHPAYPGVRPVLERVTRTRLAFLERLYRELGVPAGEAARRARLAYALYLGIGELRRADPDGDPAGAALDVYLNLAVEIVMPPAEPAG